MKFRSIAKYNLAINTRNFLYKIFDDGERKEFKRLLWVIAWQ